MPILSSAFHSSCCPATLLACCLASKPIQQKYRDLLLNSLCSHLPEGRSSNNCSRSYQGSSWGQGRATATGPLHQLLLLLLLQQQLQGLHQRLLHVSIDIYCSSIHANTLTLYWNVLWYVLWFALVLCTEYTPASIQYQQVCIQYTPVCVKYILI